MVDPYRKKAEIEDKPFPLERILTVSALEYCLSQGKQLRDYDLVGLHAKIVVTARELDHDLKEELARNIPASAEIVVAYTPSRSLNNFMFVQYADATALIPKPKEEPEEVELPDTGGPVIVRRGL